MKKYLTYLLMFCYCGCNNHQQNGKTNDQVTINLTNSGPYYKADVQIDCGVNGMPSTSIHYDFYQNSQGEVQPTEASRLLTSMLNEPHACQIISEAYKRYPNVIGIRVEDRTLTFKRVILPFSAADPTIELRSKNALSFALDYWHKCGLNFTKNKVVFVHYGDSTEVDTTHEFKVTLTGSQYGEHVGVMSWYVNGQLFTSVNGTRKLETYGEAGQTYTFHKDTDTSYSVTNLVDKDIIIDAVTPKIEEIFESIFFELLHKLVWRHRHEKMMETLNAPPYYSSTDLIMAEYTRLDEVAVHYTVICLMKEMLRNGLFPSKKTTDPFVKYKNDETYRGLLDLLVKYPPTLENGEMVLRTFMKDPREIDKLYK